LNPVFSAKTVSLPEEHPMASSDRSRDLGTLNLVSTFLASFPPTGRLEQERELASLDRVCESSVLNVQVESDGKQVVVRASGELDIASAKALEVELLQAIDSNASAVVLDLGGVTFIDSTGLRLLVFAAAHSRSKGGRLRMLHVSGQVMQVIEMSGVEDLLPLGRLRRRNPRPGISTDSPRGTQTEVM
jgi:anti-sigma B factor antagonist